MTKLEFITDIRHTLFHLRLMQDRSRDSRESVEEFQATYVQLLNRFYAENQDTVAPKQYEAAKRDVEYFMQLVDLAYRACMDWERKKTKRKSLMH